MKDWVIRRIAHLTSLIVLLAPTWSHGNGQGYLGPSTTGFTLSLSPENQLSLTAVEAQLRYCYIESAVTLTNQLLQGRDASFDGIKSSHSEMRREGGSVQYCQVKVDVSGRVRLEQEDHPFSLSMSYSLCGPGQIVVEGEGRKGLTLATESIRLPNYIWSDTRGLGVLSGQEGIVPIGNDFFRTGVDLTQIGLCLRDSNYRDWLN